MQFDSQVGPQLTLNALFKNSGRAFKNAAFMQTPAEHERAIRKFTKERERQFIRAGMTPHLHKSREPRVSCLNPGKTSRDLLQHVSRPDSPTMAREQ